MDRDIQSNVKSGREHKIQQRNVPLESKASGPGCDEAVARGRRVAHPADASHVKTCKPIELKARELKSHPNDWKGISNDPDDVYMGGAQVADARRKMAKE